jgi:hypothetical protein
MTVLNINQRVEGFVWQMYNYRDGGGLRQARVRQVIR